MLRSKEEEEVVVEGNLPEGEGLGLSGQIRRQHTILLQFLKGFRSPQQEISSRGCVDLIREIAWTNDWPLKSPSPPADAPKPKGKRAMDDFLEELKR